MSQGLPDLSPQQQLSKPEFDGEWVRLGDVCEIVMGQSPDSSSYNTDCEGLPFYQGNADFGETHPTPRTWCSEPKKVAEPGDILISVRAPVGAINVADERCCIGRGLAAVRSNGAGISNAFLALILQSKRAYLDSMSTGSTFKAIGKKVLSSCEMPLYSREVQSRIACQVNWIDDCLRSSRRQLSALDDLVKSQFIEMFGTLEEPRSGIELKTIDSICTSIVRGPFGSALKKEYFVPWHPGVYKVYEQKNAIRKQADIGDYYIEEAKFGELGRFECVPGDILMSCSGTMGELYQLPNDAVPGVINQALCKFTLDSKQILAPYFLEIMSQAVGELGAKGSGIQNIASVKYVKAVRIPVPPVELQRQFADLVARVDKLGFAA